MLLVIADVVIGVLALLVLAAVLVSGFRHVKALLRSAKDAGSRVGDATARINELQARAPRRSTP